MTVDSTAVVTLGAAAPALPSPRGPISAGLLEALTRGAEFAPVLGHSDPLGEDLQLALYLAYELHYRGFAGVLDELEWDPVVLAGRRPLEQVFLAAVRDATTGALDRSLDDLIGELVAADGGGGASDFLAREGTREQLRENAVHRSLYHLKEADPQTWVVPRLSGRAKAGIVGVQFDEYGGGSAERMHADLYAALMTELGLDAGYGRYLEDVPAPMLAVVNFMSLCGLHRRLRGALVGQLAGVEITSPPGSKRMLAALARLGGGPAAEVFYAEHVVADSVHELVLRQEVIGGLLTDEPALAADVAFGIAASGWLDDRLDEHLLGCWRAGRTSLRAPLPAAPVTAVT